MPALNLSTDTAKVYANYPQYLTPPLAGHRVVQFNGRGIQATTDNEKSNHVTGTSFIQMLKHPQ